MRLLLDTHVFLWYLSADPRLQRSVSETIAAPENDVFVSVASVWETIVKQQLGKLSLPEPAETYLPRQRARHRISSLVVTEADVALLPTLPDHHRDPFDRILVCQALHHGLTLVTTDSQVRAYPVPFL